MYNLKLRHKKRKKILIKKALFKYDDIKFLFCYSESGEQQQTIEANNLKLSVSKRVPLSITGQVMSFSESDCSILKFGDASTIFK